MLISLAILDDYRLFRKVLKNYLMDQPGFNIVADAADFPDLILKLNNGGCEIVLIEINLAGQIEASTIELLKQQWAGLKIIVLSACTDLQVVSDFIDLGIHAYISKSDDPEELVRAIKAVAENRLYHNQIFTDALYYSRQSPGKDRIKKTTVYLSEREKKIIQLLWEEKSNKEIARDVFLSVRTIEKIRQEMKEKLGIKSTIGIFKYAINQKIIVERSLGSLILRNAGCIG
jgi:DNA-binding NarL/FixJ family response regulator